MQTKKYQKIRLKEKEIFFPEETQNIHINGQKVAHILGFREATSARHYAVCSLCSLSFSAGCPRTSSEGAFFLPVNIYYNTSFEILQAK